MALRLMRSTFKRGWIHLETASDRRSMREYTDYDRFQQAAARAMSNPLVYSSYCEALYGDTTKMREPGTSFLDYPKGYDDGRETEWDVRHIESLSRDRKMNLRTKRWASNYSLSQKHRLAGEPNDWLWMRWVPVDATNGVLVDDNGQVAG